MSLLSVRQLSVHFPVADGGLRRRRQVVRAVNQVSLDIDPGETLGLVGESGCGKTTLGRAIVRLVDPTSGSVVFDGEDLSTLSEAELRSRRRRLQMIFQDPHGSLNPRLTVDSLVSEGLDIHRLATGRAERVARVRQLLDAVGLGSSFRHRYPHELSGGQRQRVGIARALALEPSLIVCDEPVSALDVSIQAQIVNLLRDLQEQRHLAYLFIAHDLAVVEHLSRRVLVMYLGGVVESGDARAVCRSPRHPYTQALISAVPTVDPGTRRNRIVLKGDVPSPIHPPSGCHFHPRCPVAEERCRREAPVLREVSPGHWAACHLVPGC